MKNFVFHNPVRIVFGKEVINEIGTFLNPGDSVLLLYGQGSIHHYGIYEKVTQSLSSAGISWKDFSGIKPNPTLTQVRSAIALCRQENLKAVIAVGGGSVIDAGKAIAAGVCYEGDVWDGFLKKISWEDALPLYVVLTISATGSEMNSAAVVTNEETKAKLSFYSPGTFPKVSFLDPTLQYTLPEQQTIYGAMDMMAHVLEFYFNGIPDTDVQDYVAEGLMKTIMKHLDTVLQHPQDYESRAQLVWTGTLALNGLNAAGRYKGDFSSHRIGHALSACYDLPHAETLSIVMPAWMRYSYKQDIPKFARFAREVFSLSGNDEDLASKGIQAFLDWIRKLNLPTSLTDTGIILENIPLIAKNPSIPYPLGTLKVLEPDDVESILRLTNYG